MTKVHSDAVSVSGTIGVEPNWAVTPTGKSLPNIATSEPGASWVVKDAPLTRLVTMGGAARSVGAKQQTAPKITTRNEDI